MINKKMRQQSRKVADLFRVMGQPARLRILLTIGDGEACVCHLEAVLGLRQAYISQQLMALRDAGILETRREGRYIFYRLKDPALLGLIQAAGEQLGIPNLNLQPQADSDYHCPCPHCENK